MAVVTATMGYGPSAAARVNRVTQAMVEAVAGAYESGITDQTAIRELQIAARDRTVAHMDALVTSSGNLYAFR